MAENVERRESNCQVLNIKATFCNKNKCRSSEYVDNVRLFGRVLYFYLSMADTNVRTAQRALHFTAWQTCSFQRHLDFYGKHSATL